MRLISYYVLHTTKNILRRLFHSKTGIVILIVAAAIMVGMVASSLEESETASQTVQQIMEEQQKQEHMQEVLFMCSGIVLLLIFLTQIGSGEKRGTGIFQMADVNLLFASPIKPQSILLVRITLQMGGYLLASVYMLFQLPNLVLNLNLSLLGAFGILIAYYLMLVVGSLCSIMTYCIAANHPRIKAMIRPAVYIIAGGFLLAFGYAVQILKYSPLEAGMKIFGGRWFYQIPLIGWIKGVASAFIQKDMMRAILFGVLIVVGIVLLLILIYRMPVDFYEDAMTGAQKMQERINASKEGRTVSRKRSEKIKRTDEIGAGFGANAFYYKTVYNHRRFAKFHLFTPSSQIYYVICIGIALLRILVQKNTDITVLFVVMGFLALFMSNGAILSSELDQNYIYLIPEKEVNKVIFCSLADLRNYTLDSFLPFAIACIMLRTEPILAIGYYLLLVSFYYISVQMGAWMDLLFPTSVAVQIKQTACYFLKIFAVLPALIVFVVFYYLGNVTGGVYTAAMISAICGAVFMFSCPGLLKKGKK